MDHINSLTSRALVLIEQRRYKDALDFLKKGIAEDPHDPYNLYLLALCQVNIPSENKHALATIEQALAINAEDAHFYALKASILIDRDKFKQATQTAEIAIQINPSNPEGHVEKSRALMAMTKWKPAEESIRKALELDPDNQRANNILATILRFRNKKDEFHEHSAQLLRKNPDDSYSHANTGWAALEQNDLKKAKYHFLEALRINPGYDYAREGILETFKAQSPLYRLYLQYCFTLAKIQRKGQIAIIIGLLVLVRILRHAFSGSFQSVGTVIVILYFVFVLWSWVARGMGNFFLLFNNFARHALLPKERIEAIMVGSTILMGAVSLILGIALANDSFFVLGSGFLFAAFPFSITFTNNHRIGQYVYGGAGSMILLSGFYLAIIHALSILSSFQEIVGISMMGIAILSVWLGSFGVFRK